MSTDEIWDLADENGRPTGETLRRSSGEPPSGRFRVVAATCAHRTDGSLLLTRRAAAKTHPLTWEFPGGSALAGEMSREAARRELREETGLLLPASALVPVGRHTERTAHVDLFAARVDDDPALTPDPREVAEAEWVRIAEVERRWRDGRLAPPWDARLEVLWPALLAAVARR